MKKGCGKSELVAMVGILTALAVCLSFLESLFPTAYFLPLGVKLGLSNIVTMFTLTAIGALPAVFIILVKSVFVMLTRGFLSGFLSLCGGIFSITALVLMTTCYKNVSFIFISIISALFHSLGQIFGVYIVTKTGGLIYYLPILLVYSVILGTVTGFLLKSIFPFLKRIRLMQVD